MARIGNLLAAVENQLDLCGTLDSLYIEDLPWQQQRQLGMEGERDY